MIELPNNIIIRRINDIYLISNIRNNDTFVIKYYNSKDVIVRNSNKELLNECRDKILNELKKIDGEIVELDYIKL